jgi:hypothetical protein
MTLHRWHELECGDGNESGSWCITRGNKSGMGLGRVNAAGEIERTGRQFVHDEDGLPHIERHHYRHGKGADSVTYTRIADREAGAKKRLAAILARYPALSSYVQTDPRGAALYILRAGDVPQGEDAGAYYSRGICVYK